MDARRLAYLDAMGIEVWQPRRAQAQAGDGAPAEAAIVLGEGDGSILCIADSAGLAGLKLAADISRAMRSPPVWAWPVDQDDADSESTTVETAIAERLFTRILVFGEGLAERLFPSGTPEIVGAARVHLVPGLARLGEDRQAKRILWQMMCEQGIAAGNATGNPSA